MCDFMNGHFSMGYTKEEGQVCIDKKHDKKGSGLSYQINFFQVILMILVGGVSLI